MLSTRLSLALETSVFTLPETGRIAVVGARAASDLTMLPNDRTTVISRFFPDYNAFEARGFAVDVGISGKQYAATIIALPRARRDAQAVIAEASAATDGPLVIDGQKTDGIASILKALKPRAHIGEVISKAHGKLFVATGGDFTDWHHAPSSVDGFMTAPGVFSADGVDPGSAALVGELPKSMKGRVIDLGAGWGYLSDAILKRESVSAVDLVEADFVALEAAKENIKDTRANFVWGDATAHTGTPADHVVMNPPFHTVRSADPDLGRAFIRQAAKLLKPKGTLWLVANRHLPYESTLEESFHTVQLLNQSASYKIYSATRPKSPR